ncbi:hypothetical protein HC231_05430 [Brenneria izadpanahii]|uniref:Uncharacterized protein n=1 Tax=Brenneria izadpanahii TaxID=2722756 RepID=A0ABX7UP44_9GAMM|nr:hypothetical protein [Brenneria izadpanahii]QTF07424.1 hypothetical protein HC231_05430 [Brenneria izadpanahii]
MVLSISGKTCIINLLGGIGAVSLDPGGAAEIEERILMDRLNPTGITLGEQTIPVQSSIWFEPG